MLADLAGVLLVPVITSGTVVTLDIIFAPVSGVLLLLALVFVGVRPWSDPLGDDIRVGRVESIFGVPSHSERRSGTTGVAIAFVHFPTYLFMPATELVSIGDKQFAVPPATEAGLDDGGAVRGDSDRGHGASLNALVQL